MITEFISKHDGVEIVFRRAENDAWFGYHAGWDIVVSQLRDQQIATKPVNRWRVAWGREHEWSKSWSVDFAEWGKAMDQAAKVFLEKTF